LAERALERSTRKRAQQAETAAAAKAAAQAAALAAEKKGITPPTPQQAMRTRSRATAARRDFKGTGLFCAAKGAYGGGGDATVPQPTPLPLASRGSAAAHYRSAAPANSYAAQWRAREFGAPATLACVSAPPARTQHQPLSPATPARPAWGRSAAAPLPAEPAAAPVAAPTEPARTIARVPLSDAQLAAGAAFAAATPLLTSAYACVKTFSSALPVAKRLLSAGAGAMLSGVLPSGDEPLLAAPCAGGDAPPSGLPGGAPGVGRRSLRHQVTHGVAHLSGGVLSADGALARAAGSAAEAGAVAAVGLAVNAAAVGCAATVAGVAATVTAIFSPPLLAGVSAFTGGRALWRALSGCRA
jgi:hypothetical protein